MYLRIVCLSLCVAAILAIRLDESFVYEEEVEIYDAHRLRRDAEQYPVEKEFVFTFKNQGHHLRLKRNSDVDIKTPVYVVRNGKIERQTIPNKKTPVFYQDTKKMAAVALYCQRKIDGICQHSLEGLLIINGTYHAIEPLEVPQRRNILHRIYQPPENIDFKADYVFPEGGKRPRQFNHTGTRRSKRYVGELKVELLPVTDYAVYDFWYQRSTQSTPAAKDTEAKEKIREFYAFTTNAIDLRYQSIAGVTFSIKVVFAGIIIADDPSISTWTESIKVSASGRDQVDSNGALVNFRTWLSSGISLPGHDHAMLFTGYDLTSGGSTSNAGLAWVSATCTSSSNSIVEDHFDAIIATVAAHELGHNLGSLHDGDGNVCLADDKYTMSPSSGGVTDSRAINHWSFSSCSVSYFEQYIADLDSGTNNCMATLTAGHDPTALDGYLTTLAGQVYSIDEQCRIKKDNSSSFFCRNFISDPAAVCAFMYCSIPDGSGYCSTAVPWEGTICGNQKWCVAGQCVADSRAASVPDSCVFGDTPGVISNGMDCATLISSFPGYCYQSYYQGKCCGSCAAVYISYIPGCEYGDHSTGCVSSSCPYYTAATLSSGCCGTCYTGTTPQPTTTTAGPTTTLGPTTSAGPTTTQDPSFSTTSTSIPSTSHLTTTLAPTTAVPTTSGATPSQAITTTTAAPCSGDSTSITIGGNNCSVAIANAPHNCYDSTINGYCCASCASVYTGVTGCEYGDRGTSCDAANCPYYDAHSRDVVCCGTCAVATTPTPGSCPNGDNPYYTVNGMNCSTAAASQSWVCYDTAIHDNCCESCPLVNNGITGCEFGDRSSSCDVANCPYYDTNSRDVVCCYTCNPPTTVSSTTLPTNIPTTTTVLSVPSSTYYFTTETMTSAPNTTHPETSEHTSHSSNPTMTMPPSPFPTYETTTAPSGSSTYHPTTTMPPSPSTAYSTTMPPSPSNAFPSTTTTTTLAPTTTTSAPPPTSLISTSAPAPSTTAAPTTSTTTTPAPSTTTTTTPAPTSTTTPSPTTTSTQAYTSTPTTTQAPTTPITTMQTPTTTATTTTPAPPTTTTSTTLSPTTTSTTSLAPTTTPTTTPALITTITTTSAPTTTTTTTTPASTTTTTTTPVPTTTTTTTPSPTTTPTTTPAPTTAISTTSAPTTTTAASTTPTTTSSQSPTTTTTSTPASTTTTTTSPAPTTTTTSTTPAPTTTTTMTPAPTTTTTTTPAPTTTTTSTTPAPTTTTTTTTTSTTTTVAPAQDPNKGLGNNRSSRMTGSYTIILSLLLAAITKTSIDVI